MEIILKEDIKGLGYKNDIVKVRHGYGRNYLIPQGLGLIATESNKKMIAENIRQAAHKADKIKKDAESIAERIGNITLEIATKAGESGKIFGSVTTLQISDALKNRGFSVDRKYITIKGEVKMLGDYSATLELHKEVKHEIAFRVVTE